MKNILRSIKIFFQAFWKFITIALILLFLLGYGVSSCTIAVSNRIKEVKAFRNPNPPSSITELQNWHPDKIYWLYLNTLDCPNISQEYAEAYEKCTKIKAIMDYQKIKQKLEKLDNIQ